MIPGLGAFRRPRSIRARLVATYTLVAVLLASIGLLLFMVLVHRSLESSLDASLATRATPIIAALDTPRTPNIQALIGPSVGPAGALLQPEIDAVTFVIRPNGGVAVQSPVALPAALLADGRRARSESRASRFTISIGGGQSLRILLVPVTRTDGVWVVGVGANPIVAKNMGGEAQRDLFIAIPIFILLAALGAWLLSGAALSPVERMRIDAETSGERDLDTRISVPDTGDELARLANTFNALLDRLRDSVDRQRDLVADAGHELRTPLAVLRIELELADRPERTRAELADAITHARSEVERLTRLAEDLLFLARADGSTSLVQPRDTDVVAVIGGAVRASRARAEAAGVTLAIDAPGELLGLVDPDAVRRAIDNLLANALAATPSGGTVTCGAVVKSSGFAVSVVDTGTGFPDDFLVHAFSRFRRADTSRNTASGGAGLGLAIVAEITAAHGGSASVANNPGGGATVMLFFPTAIPDLPSPTSEVPPRPRAEVSDGEPSHQPDPAEAAEEVSSRS